MGRHDLKKVKSWADKYGTIYYMLGHTVTVKLVTN